LVIDGTSSFKQEFAAVFNDQLARAGQGEVEAVGAQGPQFAILTPGDVHGGKRTTTIVAARLATFQIANGVIQQHSAPFHPVTLEGDPEDRFFLVRVGTNYKKAILALSRGKGEGDGLILIAGQKYLKYF
jgi:hypothetical protein